MIRELEELGFGSVFEMRNGDGEGGRTVRVQSMPALLVI